MARWEDLPRDRLAADVSLWSANLANLQVSMEAIDPFADSYHFDVADGHFAPTLLFFPDLIATLRPLSERPFHVHLMAEKPSSFINTFAEAGADVITVHAEVGETEVLAAAGRIQEAGKTPGIALRLHTPVDSIAPFLSEFDVVLLLATEIGVKGQSLAPEACDRLRSMGEMLRRVGRRNTMRLVADGGIRAETVPKLRAAGADVIVPGSLAFGSPNPAATFSWLHSLPGETA